MMGESVLKYRNIENIRLKLPIIQKSKSWEYHHEEVKWRGKRFKIPKHRKYQIETSNHTKIKELGVSS